MAEVRSFRITNNWILLTYSRCNPEPENVLDFIMGLNNKIERIVEAGVEQVVLHAYGMKAYGTRSIRLLTDYKIPQNPIAPCRWVLEFLHRWRVFHYSPSQNMLVVQCILCCSRIQSL